MSIHSGHRARLKTEFLARGFEGWPDHKVLELLLAYAIPQGDTNPLAHRLIGRFGDLAGVLDAPVEALKTVPGVGDHTAVLLKMLPKICGRYLSELEGVTETAETVNDYFHICAPYFTGAVHEKCLVLSLDARAKLLGVDVVGEGEVGLVYFSERRVLSAALGRNAAGVVLAHNHVGAYAAPSSSDQAVTGRIQNLLEAVNILLVDHIIVVGDQTVSFRESGLLKPFR